MTGRNTLVQVATIPFQRTDGVIRYLLITSRKGNWILPKGTVERGDTPVNTAVRETREEAGITGTLVEPPIGRYRDSKRGVSIEVSVYLMEYEEEVAWAERSFRERRWLSYEQARSKLRRDSVRGILDEAHRRLSRE